MASKSGSKPSSSRLFPRRGNISLLQNYVFVKVMLRTLWGETEGLVILESFVCQWEGGDAQKVGG